MGSKNTLRILSVWNKHLLFSNELRDVDWTDSETINADEYAEYRDKLYVLENKISRENPSTYLNS